MTRELTCKITLTMIENYRNYLIHDEKSRLTVEKYRRDLNAFFLFLPENKRANKETIMRYKEFLAENYKISSVNSMLVPLNGFLEYVGRNDMKIKLMKVHHQIFCAKEKELSKEEYKRLLDAAKSEKNQRLYLLMQTICATGIRVSELSCITVQAVRQGRAEVNCKGKGRIVFIPQKLCRYLLRYAKESGIESGHIFITKTGRPLDRSNIWSDMKKLCKIANVLPSKVFPHNLRHLFARTFYNIEKDINRLADILGHSSIDTTRIYTVSTGAEHERQLSVLGLVV